MAGSRKLNELEADLHRAQEEAQLYHRQADLSLQAGEQVWWSWDISSGRLVMRSAGPCVLGYEDITRPAPEQFWWERIHPEDRDEVRASLYRSFSEKGTEWHSEHRLRDITGTWIWVEQTGVVQSYDDEDEPMEMVGILRKVEERHQLIDLFSGSEAVIDTLLGQSSLVFRILDLKGREISASRKWKACHSRSSPPFRGGARGQQQHLDSDRWEKAFMKALEGGPARCVLFCGDDGKRNAYLHELLPVLQRGVSVAILEIMSAKPD